MHACKGRTLATVGRYRGWSMGREFPGVGSVLHNEGGDSQTGCHFHPPHIIPPENSVTEPARYYVPKIFQLNKLTSEYTTSHARKVNSTESSCMELKRQEHNTRCEILVCAPFYKHASDFRFTLQHLH